MAVLSVPAEVRRREEYAAFSTALQCAQIELAKLRSHLRGQLSNLAPDSPAKDQLDQATDFSVAAEAKRDAAPTESHGFRPKGLIVKVILCLAAIAVVAAAYYAHIAKPSASR
jgi:hypothetical protein